MTLHDKPVRLERMTENQREIKVTSSMLQAWDAEMERLKKENEFNVK